CPTQCPPLGECTSQSVKGEGCDAHCEPNPKITMAIGGDGCCPDDADANTDSDCNPMCGNGVLEKGETCDPVSSCKSCTSDAACLKPTVEGSGCSQSCKLEEIKNCVNGDGCCPENCDKTKDSDCPNNCGNRVIETSMGETCEANTSKP